MLPIHLFEDISDVLLSVAIVLEFNETELRLNRYCLLSFSTFNLAEVSVREALLASSFTLLLSLGKASLFNRILRLFKKHNK